MWPRRYIHRKGSVRIVTVTGFAHPASDDGAIRIAMWSGPRNVSTALLRAWGNRPDTHVIDEPLYAHYLLGTGLPHPGADEVIEVHEPDWRKVVDHITGPVPGGKRIFYQKHMAHHLLPEIGREWLPRLTHCFLIRDPREMLLSADKVLTTIRLEDTGLPQQVEIFEHVRRATGKIPPVVDARDLLGDPRAILGKLCDALSVPFREEMLSWPPGRRDTDGVWAKHWYAAVEKSTGFRPYEPRTEKLPAALEGVLEQCRGPYEKLHAARIRP